MTAASPQPPKEKDEKTPWNLQLAGILLQAMAGSGFSTLITLLNTSDLPKLALAGVLGGVGAPIAVAIGKPISKRLEQGAGFVGEAAASGGEDAAQKWLTGLSRSERRYLEVLQAYCHALEVEGFRGNLPPLALRDVFVPLRLDTDHGNVYGQAKIDTEIWHFLPRSGKKLPQNPRLAIVAEF
jgi:hypothetical protein